MFLQQVVTIQDISNLEKMITLVQTNTIFVITAFLTTLGIAVAIAGISLFYIAKASVNAGIEKGISNAEASVKKEIEGLRSEIQSRDEEFNEKVVALINNNSKIRWARGVQSFNEFIYVPGLNGNIDWNSPITSVRIQKPNSQETIPFELVDRRENSFAFKLHSSERVDQIEWTIVWSEK